MPTIEEMSLWSPEDIVTNARVLLPVGWSFYPSYNQEVRVYECTLRDNTEAVVWHEEHPDLRILLLDLYGWLHLQGQKKFSSMWVRSRQAPPGRPVVAHMGDSVNSEEYTEDTDPEFVRKFHSPRW